MTRGNGVPATSAKRQTRPEGPATVNPCDTATRCPPTPVNDLSTGIPDDPWRRQYRLHHGPELVRELPNSHHSKIITDDPAQDWQTRSSLGLLEGTEPNDRVVNVPRACRTAFTP